MDVDNIPTEEDDSLDWETQAWANDVRDLIQRSGKTYSEIVELLRKMDLRFFSWDLIRDDEDTVDWLKAFRQVSYDKRTGIYWSGEA